jgi:lipid II:glycine glycyltransferase (peptidoglycan interpeptide bridge formation enzyme)
VTGSLSIADDGIDRAAWNAFVAGHASGHFFQAWEWGELQSGLAARPQRLTATRAGALAGVVQVLHFDTGHRRFAYVPRGPVVDPDDTAAADALLDAVTRASHAAGADFIRVEPEWEFTDALAARLAATHWTRAKQFIMPRRTILVDLRPDPQTMWDRFRSNTRNRIRLAGKLGVQVRVGDETDVATFIRLAEETDARHEMRRSDPDQYTLAWRHFGARDAMRLYLASADGHDLAGLMVFVCGRKATYLWGGSTSAPEARKFNPNQLLHWTAMQWARERGCTAYDLHGIPDYDLEVLEAEYARQTGGMWNLYRFKRGFGGRIYRFVGTYDRVFQHG